MPETLPGPYKPEDPKDCPQLKFGLKWPIKEWENRAKAFNAKAFQEHSTDISTVKAAAKKLIMNNSCTVDDRALLWYISALSADKPTPIVLMQKILKDACNQSIAVDGRVGKQTIAAMKLVIERLKKEDPSYKRESTMWEKIDQITRPISIDSLIPPEVTGAPSENNQAETTEKNKTVENLNALLQNYWGKAVSINEKWELVRNGETIATIDLSKSEDTIWDNITIALNPIPQTTSTSPKPAEAVSTIARQSDKMGGVWAIDTNGISSRDIQTFITIETMILSALSWNFSEQQKRDIATFQTLNRSYFSDGSTSTPDQYTSDLLSRLPENFANEARHQKAFLLVEKKGLAPVLEPGIWNYQTKMLSQYKEARELMSAIKNQTERNKELSTKIDGDMKSLEQEIQWSSINILPDATTEFQRLGITLIKQPNNEIILQPQPEKLYTIESGNTRRPLNGKDKFDANTKSVQYDASKKEFIITNRDGTTESFKIHEVNPEQEKWERIGDLVITDTNDIAIIQEMRAKGITFRKSNSRSGGIDIQKDGEILYTCASWLDRGNETVKAWLSQFLKNNREILKKEVVRIGGTIFSQDAITAFKQIGYVITKKDFWEFLATDANWKTFNTINWDNSHTIESIDYDSTAKAFRVVLKTWEIKTFTTWEQKQEEIMPNDNEKYNANIADQTLEKLWYEFVEIDTKAWRKYQASDDKNNILFIYWGYNWIPKNRRLTKEDIVWAIFSQNEGIRKSREATWQINHLLGMNIPDAFDTENIHDLKWLTPYIENYRALSDDEYQKVKRYIISSVGKNGIDLDEGFMLDWNIQKNWGDLMLTIDGKWLQRNSADYGKVKNIIINFTKNSAVKVMNEQ